MGLSGDEIILVGQINAARPGQENPMKDAPHRSNGRVVGILYAGEMGSALGQLLADAGFKVISTLEGRGLRTSRLCRQAGLEVVSSFREVVIASDIIISLVPPSSALSVARRYCEHAWQGPESQVFIDANSISPETALQINSLVAGLKRSFADAAIQGMASRLPGGAILLLSGDKAHEVADLFAGIVKTKVLGETAGRASAYKMITSGLSKGIVALFLELAAAANELGLLDEVLAGLKEFYPGQMEMLDRLLPTYPLHAKRRGDEMEELERTILALGLEPRMIREVRRTTVAIGDLGLAQPCPPTETEGLTMRELIEGINAHQLFRA